MPQGQSRWAWLGIVLAALAFCLLAGRRAGQRPGLEALPSPPDEEGISLARRLAPRLGLRVVGTSRKGLSTPKCLFGKKSLERKDEQDLPKRHDG
jgi:hypothetical protein